jgi:D-alanyl-D-alanine carboxypeptidase
MSEGYSKAIALTAKIADAWLPHKIRYDRIPGIAVGIVHNGKSVYRKGFGYADVEAKIPVTATTCFRIASISKTFTAVAIMQLLEAGKLALDNRVGKHLPWFKKQTAGTDSDNITIRQLLSHTGGVFRDGTSPHWEDSAFPDLDGLKKSVSGKTVVFENLTRFKYSNFGYALLGQIIEKASGLTYDAYVKKHIIGKLGLTRTATDFTSKNDVWLAKGYWRPIPGLQRKAFPHSETKAYASATGFLSNVTDLTAYLAALSLKRGNELVGRESKKEMFREHGPAAIEGSFYGLGFGSYKASNRKLVGHTGGFAGFITQVSLDVENDIAVVTLTNTNDSTCAAINTGIFEMIYALADGKNDYSRGPTLKQQERFEGTDRSRWGDMVVVGVGPDLVAFDPRIHSPVIGGFLLKAAGRNKFTAKEPPGFDSPGEYVTFSFERNAKKATKLVLGASPLTRLEHLA